MSKGYKFTNWSYNDVKYLHILWFVENFLFIKFDKNVVGIYLNIFV